MGHGGSGRGGDGRVRGRTGNTVQGTGYRAVSPGWVGGDTQVLTTGKPSWECGVREEEHRESCLGPGPAGPVASRLGPGTTTQHPHPHIIRWRRWGPLVQVT